MSNNNNITMVNNMSLQTELFHLPTQNFKQWYNPT